MMIDMEHMAINGCYGLDCELCPLDGATYDSYQEKLCITPSHLKK